MPLAPSSSAASEAHTVKSRKHKAAHSQSKPGAASRQTKCKFCTTSHELVRGACPARDKKCNNCGRKGHFEAKCYQHKDKTVHSVENVDDVDSQEEEFFSV